MMLVVAIFLFGTNAGGFVSRCLLLLLLLLLLPSMMTMLSARAT
jgi:hypothetical protein